MVELFHNHKSYIVLGFCICYGVVKYFINSRLYI